MILLPWEATACGNRRMEQCVAILKAESKPSPATKFIGGLNSDYPASKLKEIKCIAYKLLRPGMRRIDSISHYSLLPRLKKMHPKSSKKPLGSWTKTPGLKLDHE